MLPERLKADMAGGLAPHFARRLLLIIFALVGCHPRTLMILASCNSPISGINRLSQGQFFVDFFDTLSIGLILVEEVAEAESAHRLVVCRLILLNDAGGPCGHRLET